MYKLLLVVLLGWFSQAAMLNLKADLKKDRQILNGHGALITTADKRKLLVFDKYAAMDLSSFKFSKQVTGKHAISHWQQTCKEQPDISMIETLVDGDVYYKDEAKKIPAKQQFHFRTYIIKQSGQRLVYLTEEHQGLCKFEIGSKWYNVSYEDIQVGFKYPDMKEIERLVPSN